MAAPGQSRVRLVSSQNLGLLLEYCTVYPVEMPVAEMMLNAYLRKELHEDRIKRYEAFLSSGPQYKGVEWPRNDSLKVDLDCLYILDVSDSILEKVILYCTEHVRDFHGRYAPIRRAKWHKRFIAGLNQKTAYELAQVAYQLEMKHLFELVRAKAAEGSGFTWLLTKEELLNATAPEAMIDEIIRRSKQSAGNFPDIDESKFLSPEVDAASSSAVVQNVAKSEVKLGKCRTKRVAISVNAKGLVFVCELPSPHFFPQSNFQL